MAPKRAINGRIGARLAEIRKFRGFSQARLAKRIDVTVGTIQAYEHGRARIAIDRLEELAQALKCEPMDFLQPLGRKIATVALLFLGLLYGGHNCWRVKADRIGEIDQLDHINAPLTAFESGNPCLRPLEFLGKLDLTNPGLFALVNNDLNETLMAFAMNGFHLF